MLWGSEIRQFKIWKLLKSWLFEDWISKGQAVALAKAMVATIQKLDHSKYRHFCLDFECVLTKWGPFVQFSNVWASRFQIQFKIRTSATQPLFDHLEYRLVRISDPHCLSNCSFFQVFNGVKKLSKPRRLTSTESSGLLQPVRPQLFLS